MENTFEKELSVIRKKLAAFGQEQLLPPADAAGVYGGSALREYLGVLEKIDFEQMNELYRFARETSSGGEGSISPIPVTVAAALSERKRARLFAKGEKILREGGFAAVTMAGGQGTRLGHDGPKGTYDIGVAERSLFGIQAKRLLRRAELSSCPQIPWYIMTSGENDAQTRDFFRANGYFGYSEDNVRFFTQFMLPMVDFDGLIVRDAPMHVKQGADGHGGIFRAMHRHGIVSDMRARGVKYVFIGGIDNVLVKLCDPLFIGFTADGGYGAAGKSLIKRDPREKAGVFCLRDGRPHVVEYTEITEEMAEAVDGNGDYIYGDAHILCNMFSIGMLETAGEKGLPYHVAVKKTKYIDREGILREPDAPNAYKFEAFIFDAFSQCGNMGILRVKREDEFAPVKNREGEDSPETARALYESALRRGALD